MLKSQIFALLVVLPTLCASAQETKGPVAPDLAPGHMTLPPGFRATLFAGEPDIVQPIAFCFDDRGRLWVAENHSYPNWSQDPRQPGHDRILIFDDPDSTGHFKTRKVFADNISNLSGLEVGFGGVFVCSAPNLLFIPANDDRPAGPPQVLLDGWTTQAKHNIFNRLTWGPDGWLWGLHGILATSNVGRPGTPDGQRIKLNCAVWRYHPVTKAFEVVANGTTNPWGLDFDEMGQAFITNCVIKHLFQVIPGAHYARMYGQDLDPYAYGLIESCADHIHWAGGDWTTSRGGQGAHSAAGGGHAHAGAMVYLGDNWPDAYRGSIFMCNIHGSRVNHDILEHKGSGYVAHHGKDFLFANDPWFRGLDLHYGPDGGVFVSDWTDTGECHNYDKIDRSNGRIYKVVYGDVHPVRVDLARESDQELIGDLGHRNHWFRRHATRVLEERAASGKLDTATRDTLFKLLAAPRKTADTLSIVWALHATGGIGAGPVSNLLTSDEPYVRAWAIRLACEETLGMHAAFLEHARSDPSPVVRLAIASALQRISIEQRWALAEALASHAEDASDANLPLMIWYGIEPAVAADPSRAASFLARCRIPLLRQYTARRLASPSGKKQPQDRK